MWVPHTVRRSPRPARLTIRTRLTLLCLSLFVLSGTLLMILMNVLISVELSNAYTRPIVVTMDPDIAGTGSPVLPGDRLTQAITSSNDTADAVARQIRLQSLISFGVLTVLASGLCWFVSGRVLRPVRRITAVASRLSQDTIDERIAYHGPRDELRTLAESFDAMLDRLGCAFDGQRLFVANASHELRTPLTVIRTAADVTLSEPTRPEADYRRTLATIETAVRRSEDLLDSLLRLARTQHRRAALQPLDLAEAARAATARHPTRRPHLRTDLAPAPVMADPVLIELLLRNLLDNAIRYNQPDGWIHLRTRTQDGAAILEVENTGQPIPAEQIPQLVRAFHRGEHTRTLPGQGLGLGLAIVNAIVEAHTGRLHITPRPAGGLHTTVTLPAPPGNPTAAATQLSG
jgi:signal transduction histidine kinase